MTQPLVSIVICCHNRRDYLEASLQSVLRQEYQPVEIIVMDDGSTDGSDNLVRSVGGDIKYFRQESQGIAVARTRASELATGEYIAYHDDDDLMPPLRIEMLLAALVKYPEAVLATGDYELINAAGDFVGHRWLPLADGQENGISLLADGQEAVLWPRVPAVPHTTLFRRKDGERIGWFDHNFRYACSDADFLARLGQLGPIAYTREVVSYYRRGHAQIWADDARASISRIQLWSKHLGLIDADRSMLKNQVRTRMFNVLVNLDLMDKRGDLAKEYKWNEYRAVGLGCLGPGLRSRYFWRTKVINNLKMVRDGKPR